MIGYIRASEMRTDFQLFAGHAALDFANTLDYRYVPRQRVELLTDFESFVAFTRQTQIISRGQAQRLLAKTSYRDAERAMRQIVELREALYFLFLSIVRRRSPDRLYLDTYNRLTSQISVPDALVWEKRRFVAYFPGLAESPCGPLRPIMDGAAKLLTSPDRHHIGECHDETCRWLFLDHSKNHSRRWCSMQICGNRSKAQRFYAREERFSKRK